MTSDRAEIYPLRRREVVARLVAGPGALLVVGGLGAPSWGRTAAGDPPLPFPPLGAIGGAARLAPGAAPAGGVGAGLAPRGSGAHLWALCLRLACPSPPHQAHARQSAQTHRHPRIQEGPAQAYELAARAFPLSGRGSFARRHELPAHLFTVN